MKVGRGIERIVEDPLVSSTIICRETRPLGPLTLAKRKFEEM